MTRDDIIRMAKEAGHPFLTEVSVEEFVGMVPPWLERFAALVAAAEREACAEICELGQKKERRFDTGRLWCAMMIRKRGEK